MKALFLSAAVAALATFAACSSSEKAEKTESSLASKIENCTNTDSLKAYVEDAKAYVAKLQSEGVFGILGGIADCVLGVFYFVCHRVGDSLLGAVGLLGCHA